MPTDIRKPLQKFAPHFLKAQEENVNEADTVLRVIKCFENVLGYDALCEISREKQVRNRFVDIAIKTDGVIRLLIEVKAAGETLRERHIEQAERYAAEGNIRWVLLTNGVSWHLYHLTFDEGVEYERVFAVDVTSENAFELLGLLHRQSIRKNELEEYWKKRAVLAPGAIGNALFTNVVLRLIRRELRRKEGFLVDIEDLASSIHSLFSVEAREQIGPLQIRRKRKYQKKAVPTAQGEPVGAEPSTGKIN